MLACSELLKCQMSDQLKGCMLYNLNRCGLTLSRKGQAKVDKSKNEWITIDSRVENYAKLEQNVASDKNISSKGLGQLFSSRGS